MPLFKNNREKLLAGLLGGMLAGLGIIVGTGALFDFRRTLEDRMARIESEELEAESWIGEEEFWKGRGEWLASKQPKMGEPRREGLELLQKIEASARSHGVEVTGRMIKDVVSTPQFSGTPIRVDAAGAFPGLFAWLHELQQPGNFILVNELILKSSGKPDVLDCSVEIMRCYQPVAEKKGS
jgi:hypothetical protein